MVSLPGWQPNIENHIVDGPIATLRSDGIGSVQVVVSAGRGRRLGLGNRIDTRSKIVKQVGTISSRLYGDVDSITQVIGALQSHIDVLDSGFRSIKDAIVVGIKENGSGQAVAADVKRVLAGVASVTIGIGIIAFTGFNALQRCGVA